MDTKKLRQKILDLAIRGKLVPQDPNDEPASVLLERIRTEKERLVKEGKIKRSKKSVTDDEIEAPFEIPESWEWTTIGEIASSILYGVSESAKESGNYKLLRITDIQNNKVNWETVPFTNYDEKKAQPYLLKDGDILFARTGATVGKSYLVEGLLQPSIYASYLIRVQTSSVILPSYIKLFFESGYYWEQITLSSLGIGQPNVNGTTLATLSIPIPPYQEQQRISREIEHWFAVFDALESNEGDLLKAIDQAKSKILDLAIHGKLVPQDPNDEPAIELLKRINPKFEPCDNAPYENIPCKWEVCTINDIASSELGKTLDKEKNKGEYKPYLCSINVFWNQFNLTEMKQMRFEDSELEHYSIKQGDLVICEGGDAGRCAVWPYSHTALFQNAIHRVRFKEDIVPYFYMYVIMYLKNKHILENYCKGVTIKHFTKTALLSLPVPLPPIKEQLRIVAKIEELFSVLDEIKESLDV